MDRCSGELWGVRVRIIHHSVSALLSLSDLMMHPMGSVGERERERVRGGSGRQSIYRVRANAKHMFGVLSNMYCIGFIKMFLVKYLL